MQMLAEILCYNWRAVNFTRKNFSTQSRNATGKGAVYRILLSNYIVHAFAQNNVRQFEVPHRDDIHLKTIEFCIDRRTDAYRYI